MQTILDICLASCIYGISLPNIFQFNARITKSVISGRRDERKNVGVSQTYIHIYMNASWCQAIMQSTKHFAIYTRKTTHEHVCI